MANVIFPAINANPSRQGAIHISTQKTGVDMSTRTDFSALVPSSTGALDTMIGTRFDHPRYYTASGT